MCDTPQCCLQARLPFDIAIVTRRNFGRSQWTYYAWRMPTDPARHLHVHAQRYAMCTEVRSASHDCKTRRCGNSAAIRLCVPQETAKYLITQILGKQAHRSNTAKQERIHKLVNGPAATAELSDYIAAGFDVTDMQFLNGAQADEAFVPLEQALTALLESRSLLATNNRRHDESEAAGPVVRPPPLAVSIRQLRSLVEEKLRADPDTASKLDAGSIKLPSESALSARMYPSHPSRLTSSRKTGALGIMWAIQRRVLRKFSVDTHYVNALGLYAREFVLDCAAMGTDVLYISDDDKYGARCLWARLGSCKPQPPVRGASL